MLSHPDIYIIYDLMPRWMQKTADVISVLLIVGFTFALVCIQAVSNLIADWNNVTVSHTPADEVDEHEIETIRPTLGEKRSMVDIGTLSLILLLGIFALLAIGMPLGFASAFLAVVMLMLRFDPSILFGTFGRGPLSVLGQAI